MFSVGMMLERMGHDFGYVREPFASLTKEPEVRLHRGLIAIRDKFGAHRMAALEKL